MHVSMHMSPQSRGPEEDLEIIEEVVRQAVAGDAAGIASFCLTEHHFAGYNTYCDPFLLGSYLAGQLRQAHIAITVVQMALQHPLRIAEHCNMLDLLMRGRLLVALAPGSASPIELEAFGIDPETRSQRSSQRIESMLRAWGREEGDPPIDVSNDFDQGLLHGRLMPTSYRRPHPLLARATTTDATIADCARRGWPVILGARIREGDTNQRQIDLYRETLESSGHSEETVRECLSWLGFVSFVSIAPTEQEAKQIYDEYLEVGGTGPTLGKEGIPQPWAEEWTKRQLKRAGVAVTGTPEQVAEYLHSFKEVGVDHARVAFVATSGKPEQAMESFQLFIEEALPLLDPQPLPGAGRSLLPEEDAAALEPVGEAVRPQR